MSKSKAKFNILDILQIALFVALISVCAWISIPFAIPFTLQTLAIFLACLYLGGGKAFAAVVAYLLLGFCGAPVFSGFLGGIGVLFSLQGGFLLGFLAIPLLHIIFKKNSKIKLLLLITGLLVCYVVGAIWYWFLLGGEKGFLNVISVCILPFIVPDIAKLFIANLIYKRIKPR